MALRQRPQCGVIPGLKLKRKMGEKIVVKHKDEILIIQYSGNYSAGYIQLAFSNSDFTIYREELYLKNLEAVHALD